MICPYDQFPLVDLNCPLGHQFNSYDGIPVLLREDVAETIWFASNSIKQAKGEIPVCDIENFASQAIASTSGHLYVPLIGKDEYPIPDIPLSGAGRLLDVGCGWGRWSIAAARKGYEVVAIDPALDFLLAARKVCKELGVDVTFICADSRYLPFETNSFDQCFSFSVLQHFAKPDARRAVSEMKRVGRKTMIQFAGKHGIRSLYHQAKRQFKEPENFEVRYWAKNELAKLGKVTSQGFFGTGVLKSDVKYLPLKYKSIPYVSDLLTKLRIFDSVADSYWLKA